jgi:hypothetical protein
MGIAGAQIEFGVNRVVSSSRLLRSVIIWIEPERTIFMRRIFISKLGCLAMRRETDSKRFRGSREWSSA